MRDTLDRFVPGLVLARHENNIQKMFDKSCSIYSEYSLVGILFASFNIFIV